MLQRSQAFSIWPTKSYIVPIFVIKTQPEIENQKTSSKRLREYKNGEMSHFIQGQYTMLKPKQARTNQHL